MFGLRGHRRQQRVFDFAARDIFGMQNAPFGMPALLAQIQFPGAVGARHFPFGEIHPQLNQLRDPRRALLDNRAHDLLFAQSCSGL